MQKSWEGLLWCFCFRIIQQILIGYTCSCSHDNKYLFRNQTSGFCPIRLFKLTKNWIRMLMWSKAQECSVVRVTDVLNETTSGSEPWVLTWCCRPNGPSVPPEPAWFNNQVWFWCVAVLLRGDSDPEQTVLLCRTLWFNDCWCVQSINIIINIFIENQWSFFRYIKKMK